MKKLPLLATVIMATRDKATYLDLTLASLERQTIPLQCWEIVVVDDASEDNTFDVLERYAHKGTLQLRIRRSRENRGRAGARNDALDLAQGKIVVFLDDDRIVGKDFLFWHLVHQADEPQIVVGDPSHYIHTHIAPNIHSQMWELTQSVSSGDRHEEMASGNPRQIVFPEDLDNPKRLASLTLRDLGDWGLAVSKMDRERIPYPSPWTFFTTGNASAPLQDLQDIGGFDEIYQGWGLEDNDICVRLLQRGLKLRYEGRAAPLHQRHAVGPQQRAEHQQNLERFMNKFPELKTADNALLLQGSLNLEQWIRTCQTNQEINARRQGHPDVLGSGLRIVWAVRSSDIANARRSHALFQEVIDNHPSLSVCWVASGAAAQWLRAQGSFVEDSSTNSPKDIFDTSVNAIKKYRPCFVISDEEPLVLPIAHHENVASVYITHHLESERAVPEATFYQYAQRILFADTPGSFSLAPEYFSRVDFCGPWVQDNTHIQDHSWRTLISKQDQKLVVVNVVDDAPGIQEYVLNLVAAANLLTAPITVAVLGGSLPKDLQEKLPDGVFVLNNVPEPMQFLRNADVVVTPPEHTVLWELAAARVSTLIAPQLGNSGFKEAALLTRFMNMPNTFTVLEQDADAEALSSVLDNTLEAKRRSFDPVNFEVCRSKGANILLDYLLSAQAKISK